MDDFKWIFSFFDTYFLTSLEKGLISKLFPVIKEIIERFTTTRRGYGSWPRYDTSLSDTSTILDLKGKIEKIVEVLDSSDQTREDFLKNFPKWEIKRTENIKELRKIAESMKDVRKRCNIAKITTGGVGLIGGGAIIGSLLFPPAAPALLPTWLGGAAAAALLPSIFLGTAPAVSSLAVAGGVATAGGAIGIAGASITELVLTDKNLNEVRKVIAADRKLLETLGVFEFLDELNNAIDDLFGKSTSSKILNDLTDFLDKVPPILGDDIRPILKALRICMELMLPGLTTFLLIGIALASVILSIFFVVFLIRRRGCAILNHRLALGLVSAVDAGVEITRLIAAAGLKGSKLGELIPRQLAGKIAVGAMAGVGIALDVATIIISSIDLAEGSLSDEVSLISEVAKKLESHLLSYRHVNEELQRCVARRLKKNDVKCWTAVVVNHVPLNAGLVDITSAIKQYLSDEACDCILLEKLPTSGNHWLVKVPTSHAQELLRQNHINIKRERCLVMK